MADRRADERVVVTYQDYLEFPNDGKRYEILDGDPHVTPAPDWYHQTVLWNLGNILREFVESRGLGAVMMAPFDVVLDNTNVVQPDLIYVSKASRVRKRGHLAGAPDLAVEVLSPSNAKHDRSLKLRAYARHGVAHYWIVDPKRRKLEERVLAKKAYRLVASLSGPEVLRSQIFPELAIELGRVWCD